MGEIKKNISQLSKDAGGMARAASAAEDWFNTSKTRLSFCKGGRIVSRLAI